MGVPQIRNPARDNGTRLRVVAMVLPELQVVLDKYNQIEEDMVEEQVDAILAGHKASLLKEITYEANGKPLKRKSSYWKMYYKPGAQEGDYTVHIYFDDDGYVVGKSLGGLVK